MAWRDAWRDKLISVRRKNIVSSVILQSSDVMSCAICGPILKRLSHPVAVLVSGGLRAAWKRDRCWDGGNRSTNRGRESCLGVITRAPRPRGRTPSRIESQGRRHVNSGSWSALHCFLIFYLFQNWKPWRCRVCAVPPFLTHTHAHTNTTQFLDIKHGLAASMPFLPHRLAVEAIDFPATYALFVCADTLGA